MKDSFFAILIRVTKNDLIVTDKRGANIFFPWGNGRKGYIIDDERLIPRIKKFYSVSLIVCFTTIFILQFSWGNLFCLVGTLFGCLMIWLTVWYSYANNVIKSLTPSQSNYSEIILERDYEMEEKDHQKEESN
jgi:hypothetical protein